MVSDEAIGKILERMLDGQLETHRAMVRLMMTTKTLLGHDAFRQAWKDLTPVTEDTNWKDIDPDWANDLRKAIAELTAA